MMLRSSSTPLLGSLLPSFSETSSAEILHTQTPIHAHIWNSKSGGRGTHNFRPFRSPSMGETTGICRGFRRVQSEGNLEELADSSYATSGRSLESISSFSFTPCEQEEKPDLLQIKTMVLQEGTEVKNEYDSRGCEGKMYLAIGIGADGFTGGGGGSSRPYNRVNGDSQNHDLEDHYKRMLEEDPRNPLALRNYASFLYQVKGDLMRAEEYSWRAVLASPEDGDILSQYAKITWELHKDQEKANLYFEKAVRASPVDSHVHAAFASFLWNMGEDDEADEEEAMESSQLGHPVFRYQGGLHAATT